MEPQQVSYKNSVINYYRFGRGTQIALCFHGYGETGESYHFLAKHAGDQFTFYSLDLPFHGKTEWKEGLDFSVADLHQICRKITAEQDPQLQATNTRLTLLGFSLGGRMALSLYHLDPANIERIILLAPDGLKVNFWYWLATQSWIGNKFFAFTMKKPGWFFTFLKLMNRIGVVNASIFKFVNYYIGDSEVRQQLYKRWTALRLLKPPLGTIKSLIVSNQTQVKLIYGKHDRIILASVGEKFSRGIEAFCTIRVIASGHQVLHEKHVSEILPALRH